ncbi:hypothetical protein AAKU52_000357 [Pedobacter sp. CG_S7]
MLQINFGPFPLLETQLLLLRAVAETDVAEVVYAVNVADEPWRLKTLLGFSNIINYNLCP